MSSICPSVWKRGIYSYFKIYKRAGKPKSMVMKVHWAMNQNNEFWTFSEHRHNYLLSVSSFVEEWYYVLAIPIVFLYFITNLSFTVYSPGYTIQWNQRNIPVFRPDVECINGIIHVIDHPFLIDGDIRVTGGTSTLHRINYAVYILSALTILVLHTSNSVWL